jgi:hypothetical protein
MTSRPVEQLLSSDHKDRSRRPPTIRLSSICQNFAVIDPIRPRAHPGVPQPPSATNPADFPPPIGLICLFDLQALPNRLKPQHLARIGIGGEINQPVGPCAYVANPPHAVFQQPFLVHHASVGELKAGEQLP